MKCSMVVCVYILFVSIVSFGSGAKNVGVSKLEEVYSWKQITYNIDGYKLLTSRRTGPEIDENGDLVGFPEELESDNQTQQDDYFIQYNNIPMGVDRWREKIFVMVPRRRIGIPSTLNYISLVEDKDVKTPGLRPYPDFKTNSLTSKTPLVSVYRTKVDICNRIWMVDTGVTETQGTRKVIQPPAIVIFDLETNKLLRRYELRDNDYTCSDSSGFISLAVDINNNECDDAYAYLPDLVNNAMVVYSYGKNTSWRVKHNYFHLEPERGDMNIGGIPFQWDDGIFSIALGPVNGDGFRNAYFHAMASNKERSVNTAILKNETLATRFYHGNDFKTVGSRGYKGQSNIHAVHLDSGIMIFNQINKNALTCWNMSKKLTQSNLGIIAQHDTKFIYPSDMKIENNNIWVISNKMPIFIYSKLNTSEVNFRIYRTTMHDAIAGTPCTA